MASINPVEIAKTYTSAAGAKNAPMGSVKEAAQRFVQDSANALKEVEESVAVAKKPMKEVISEVKTPDVLDVVEAYKAAHNIQI